MMMIVVDDVQEHVALVEEDDPESSLS